MKKHILGFALFSFIVASFAFAYAFFFAPSLVSKEAVKPPVTQTETRTETPYYSRTRCKKFSYEVLSSQYFVDENKIVTKIRVSQNESVAPAKIFVTTSFSSAGNIDKNTSVTYQIIENPFAEGREKIVTLVSRVNDGRKINIDENLYASVAVTDSDGATGYKKSEEIMQTKPVLFVYGEKTSRILRGRVIN
jgi:hypothetical protein